MNEIEEKRLYIYIENRIIECLQNFCQYKMFKALREELRVMEADKLTKILEPIILKTLEDEAPLHNKNLKYENRNMHLLEGIFYNTHFKYDDYQKYQWNQEYQNGGWYWARITNKEIMQEGFSKIKIKDTIDKFLDQSLLKEKVMEEDIYILYTIPLS